MLKLFLKKKFLSDGSAFTKCEFLLRNKKIFLSKLEFFFFISNKNFKLFRHRFIEIYLNIENIKHLLHGCRI